MDARTEQALIRRTLEGHRPSAEELIRAHQGSLFLYLFRLCGKRQVAEDFAQEALFRAIARLGDFNPAYRFSTWLFTIARRLWLSSLDKKQPFARDPGTLDERSTGRTASSDLEEAESRRVQGTAIHAALQALPWTQREIVTLYHQHSWPIAEIARHMGIPVGTVKSHLHRARAKLRRELCPPAPAMQAAGVRRSAGAALESLGLPRDAPSLPGGRGEARA